MNMVVARLTKKEMKIVAFMRISAKMVVHR